MHRKVPRQRREADVVASKSDEIGRERVDALDDTADEPGLGELVVVDVGDLRDAEAVEGPRQVADGDRESENADLVPGNLAGINGHARNGEPRAPQEVAPRE